MLVKFVHCFLNVYNFIIYIILHILTMILNIIEAFMIRTKLELNF